MSDFLERIDHKLDIIVERLVRVEASYDHNAEKIKAIYEQHLAPLIAAVAENQRKIAQIEVELTKMKTTIAIGGTFAVIIISAIISMAVQILLE